MTLEDPPLAPLDSLPEPNLTDGQVSIAQGPGEPAPEDGSRTRPMPVQAPLPGPAQRPAPLCCWVAGISSVCSLVLAGLLWLRPGGPAAPPPVAPAPAAAPPATGVAQPAPPALQPYLDAARAGDVNAMRMLGAMYYHGLDLPRNRAEGLQWYRQAAASGSKVAQEELKQLE